MPSGLVSDLRASVGGQGPPEARQRGQGHRSPEVPDGLRARVDGACCRAAEAAEVGAQLRGGAGRCRWRGPSTSTSSAAYLRRLRRRRPTCTRSSRLAGARTMPGQLVPPEDYFTGDLWEKYDRAKERAARATTRRLRRQATRVAIQPSVFDDIVQDAFSPQQAWIPLSLVECWIESLAKVGVVRLERREGLVQVVGKDYADIDGGWKNDVGNVLGWINHDKSLFKPQKRNKEDNIDDARLAKAEEWRKAFHRLVLCDRGPQADHRAAPTSARSRATSRRSSTSIPCPSRAGERTWCCGPTRTPPLAASSRTGAVSSLSTSALARRTRAPPSWPRRARKGGRSAR